MSILESKIKDLNTTDIKSPKKIAKKNLSTPKKVNLCKKYFYINNNKNMNLKHFNNGRILQLIENANKNGSGDPLEQVDHILTQLDQTREELNNKKVDCIKSMILNHKRIPEKWIMKPNYKDLLNKAMEDDIVLNYAVLCKDIYKKREGLDQTKEKKFISFINLYSKNYCDSPHKKKVMRDYCLSITKNKKNRIKAKAINDSSLNSYERNSKLYNKVLEDKTSNSFEDSTKDKNILPLINQNNRIDNNNNLNNMNDTKDDLMVTSLYYSGFDNKNENNYNNLNPKKELKLPELPLI